MPTRSAPPARLGPLSHLAGGGLALLLVFGPLAFACTRPEPLSWLSRGLHGVVGVWILGLIVERRFPGIPRLAFNSAIALILYAWLRLWWGESVPISGFTLSHFSRIYDRWPESIILRTPETITFLASGLLGGFLVATDLTRRSLWRRTLLFTMVGVGCSVVILGLVQNATHAPGIYWERPKNHMPSPFFGPFYHFTSAGAFLNLTWPLAASMALYSFRRYASEAKPVLPVVLWGFISILLLLGHAGHVSRFPQVIAIAVLLGLIGVHRPLKQLRWSWRLFGSAGAAALVLGCSVLWVVGRTGRIHDITARWQMLNVWGTNTPAPPLPPKDDWPRLMRDDLVVPYDHDAIFLRDRGAAYAFAATTLTHRPLFGFGPGGWIAAVSQWATDPVIGTFYLYLQFTHEDFLQTLIEWGLVGGMLWLILVGGGIYTGFQRFKNPHQRWSGRPDFSALIVGALAAVFAVLVQALIDFPLQIPANALYACILLAVCWSSGARDSLSASSTQHVHEQ